jgi:YidC/Oxa1 family membrane protein insertase
MTYRYAANGLDVVKTFRFDSSYVVGVETSVKRNGAPVRALVEWPAGLGDMEEFLPSSSTRSRCAPRPLLRVVARRQRPIRAAAKKVSGNNTLDRSRTATRRHGSLLCRGLPARQPGSAPR